MPQVQFHSQVAWCYSKGVNVFMLSGKEYHFDLKAMPLWHQNLVNFKSFHLFCQRVISHPLLKFRNFSVLIISVGFVLNLSSFGVNPRKVYACYRCTLIKCKHIDATFNERDLTIQRKRDSFKYKEHKLTVRNHG